MPNLEARTGLLMYWGWWASPCLKLSSPFWMRVCVHFSGTIFFSFNQVVKYHITPFFLSWSIADLRCRGNFCCSSKWLSFKYTHTLFLIFFSIIVYHRILNLVFLNLFLFKSFFKKDKHLSTFHAPFPSLPFTNVCIVKNCSWGQV